MKEARDRDPDLCGSQPEKPKCRFLLPECHGRLGTWHVIPGSHTLHLERLKSGQQGQGATGWMVCGEPAETFSLASVSGHATGTTTTATMVWQV